MELTQKLTQRDVWKRALWAYGIYVWLVLIAFAAGYFIVPPGALRETPFTALGMIAEQQKGFWAEFLTTVGFNLAFAFLLGVGCSLQRVRGLPAGYVFLFATGIVSGLVAGTNSFVVPVVSPYTVQGWLVALRIQHLELLGYTIIVAATIGVGLRDYSSWIPWKAKSSKIRSVREIKVSRQEMFWVVIGILLVLLAGYNETSLVSRGS